ncbi:MAG: PQLLE family protein [Paludibacter sp.]
MEELNTIQDQIKKSKRKTYISLAKWIDKMSLAFDNAILPTIYPYLLTVGYDEAKLGGLRDQLTQLISLDQSQIRARAEQQAATDASRKKRKEINGLYLKHRSLIKILLSENTLASASLKLKGQRKKSYGEWFQDVSSFYTQLTQTPELTAHATSVGISQPVIDSQKQLLVELQTLKETQRKKTADTRLATEQRIRAFNQLRQLYAEYIKYARILLAGDQALEAIGIVVKRK